MSTDDDDCLEITQGMPFPQHVSAVQYSVDGPRRRPNVQPNVEPTNQWALFEDLFSTIFTNQNGALPNGEPEVIHQFAQQIMNLADQIGGQSAAQTAPGTSEDAQPGEVESNDIDGPSEQYSERPGAQGNAIFPTIVASEITEKQCSEEPGAQDLELSETLTVCAQNSVSPSLSAPEPIQSQSFGPPGAQEIESMSGTTSPATPAERSQLDNQHFHAQDIAEPIGAQDNAIFPGRAAQEGQVAPNAELLQAQDIHPFGAVEPTQCSTHCSGPSGSQESAISPGRVAEDGPVIPNDAKGAKEQGAAVAETTQIKDGSFGPPATLAPEVIERKCSGKPGADEFEGMPELARHCSEPPETQGNACLSPGTVPLIAVPETTQLDEFEPPGTQDSGPMFVTIPIPNSAVGQCSGPPGTQQTGRSMINLPTSSNSDYDIFQGAQDIARIIAKSSNVINPEPTLEQHLQRLLELFQASKASGSRESFITFNLGLAGKNFGELKDLMVMALARVTDLEQELSTVKGELAKGKESEDGLRTESEKLIEKLEQYRENGTYWRAKYKKLKNKTEPAPESAATVSSVAGSSRPTSTETPRLCQPNDESAIDADVHLGGTAFPVPAPFLDIALKNVLAQQSHSAASHAPKFEDYLRRTDVKKAYGYLKKNNCLRTVGYPEDRLPQKVNNPPRKHHLLNWAKDEPTQPSRSDLEERKALVTTLQEEQVRFNWITVESIHAQSEKKRMIKQNKNANKEVEKMMKPKRKNEHAVPSYEENEACYKNCKKFRRF